VAALVLCAGFAAFLVWQLFNVEWSNPWHIGLVALHSLVIAVSGVCAAALCRTCTITTRILRTKEAVLFGLVVLYFVYMQYLEITSHVSAFGVLPAITPAWLMLIFVYAVFIPNTWQRAAVVLGLFAAAPMLLLLVLVSFDSAIAAARNLDVSYYTLLACVMVIAAATATVGVHTIGALRREAFHAKQLGRYQLRERIGGGGMGEVFLAEHYLMKRPCAIKIIRPERAGDPRVLARFEREVQATARLSHWNSVHIFDYGRADDGTFYYVMEYLPGMDLGELVDRYGPMPPERVLHLLRQTCDALSEAHDAGLIHRDLKPANIIASHRGGVYDVAKLLDFGLVKSLAEFDGSKLTQDGAITGSPLFMSPEQAAGETDPDARSDIYSLGAIAYLLLTGHPPFEDDKPLKVLAAHLHQEPRPMSELRSGLPADLEQVVMRCLAKRPEDRYQSVAELISALDSCEHAGGWTRQHAADWWQNHRDMAREPQAPALV
jgi:serine/threonine-protein kinase